jgi:transcriptional regulator with XRE-family HTH domain
VRTSIGLRLRRARERLGESQATFAARLGVSKLSVLNYESGSSCPGVDQLSTLATESIDVCEIAFGFPSLATAQSRSRFSAALAWVRQECAVSSLRISDEALVEAAWVVFCELNKQAHVDGPRERELLTAARSALLSVVGEPDGS